MATDNIATAEAYPHFSHSEYPDGGNYIPDEEVILFFRINLPEVKGGGSSGMDKGCFDPDKLHCLFFEWNPNAPNGGYKFWQAIIHPDTKNPLIFERYKVVEGKKSPLWLRDP